MKKHSPTCRQTGRVHFISARSADGGVWYSKHPRCADCNVGLESDANSFEGGTADKIAEVLSAQSDAGVAA